MPQLARLRLRVVVLYVQMLSAVFNTYYKKSMTCSKSTTSINIYVVKITFCSVNALSAGLFSYFSVHHIKYAT